MAAMLAEMQAMHAELNALRQAPELGPVANGAVPIAPGGGEPVIAPQRPLELRDWCGMSLEKFAGTSAPIEAADWLSAVIDKMESFQVPTSDWVRYAHQLLKGEALVWWRNVQMSQFVSQFERRFYPIAFVDKTKTQLERCHQGKRTVVEYEMEFNQIVRFVPHVAHDEYEKARIFRQGLKASIRQVLGAFVLEDFRSTVERALGVEVRDDYTEELRGGDHSQGQKDQKGHSGGLIQKKDKHRGSRDGSTQYRAVVRPGLGLVCFRCGDAHRRADCRWTGQCSRCSKDHKVVVCRKNLNSKIIWEPVASSSPGQCGSAHMMAGVSLGQQHSTPTQQFLPASFVQ
ncbi:hypothetical protein PVAP13_4KG164705 [Panicum virgatum]|uniref:Retrotransposon gag domain-containing protein n=1 Tax=Panicum virgatum TaxID=38727 RepID=A0A8T0TQX6_PANVG|nr:hypothetical protein PVAP13_4KG164705 [Panicum virgatum]